MSARLFPLFADLNGRPVLVVGGGAVARRKVQALLEAGAQVRVGANALEPWLQEQVAQGRVQRLPGAFTPAWLDEVWLAVAATDDIELNRAVAEAGRQCRVWVNVVDDAEASAFHIPARVERGPLQVAISSGGGAPMLARHLRERLETEYDESLGELAQLLTHERARIRGRFPDIGARRRFFDALLAGPVPRLLRQCRVEDARHLLEQLLGVDGPAPGAAQPTPAPAKVSADPSMEAAPLRVARLQPASGSVALVGAGPGDPGLLTLRALRVLNEADVILYDRLVSAEVLALARRDAERIEVGKQGGGHSVSQQHIHALMLAHARDGRRVVRLKGGDPFVFGRGGEELECLRAHGIDYEVVPGITAAVACAAYAGVPLTHRDHAQSVRLVTAHCRDSFDTLDWSALAQERQTLAVYMGVAGLAELRDRLVAHGRSAETPFALVENGSRREQRVVAGVLRDLPDLAATHAVSSPALLIVGEVAGLARALHWFGAPPLGGAPASACTDEAAPERLTIPPPLARVA